MGFLNSTTKGNQGEFIVDNATGGGELAVNGDSVSVEITCDKSIEKIEVENSQTGQWSEVTQLASETQFNCGTSGEAQLKLPLDYIAPYQAPTRPGDIGQDFKIRWYVKNLAGEVHVFYRTLTVKFKAPDVTIAAAEDINLAHSGGGNYEVSGTCGLAAGLIAIHGPFVGAPVPATCDSNKRFLVVTSYSGSTSMTEAEVRVTHSQSGDFRAYAEVRKTVKVDVVAPAVEILVPVAGTVFTASDFAGKDTVTVSGTCSEPQQWVNIKANGLGIVDVFCSADGKFQGEVLLAAEGPATLQALHQDAAGNLVGSTETLIERDTEGPGPFQISGIRAIAGADTTVDDKLTDAGPTIYFTAAQDAVEYELLVKSADNATTVCPSRKETAAGLSNFSACLLAQGTSYKIYAQAKDAHGNMTSATNTGFVFTTIFPVPRITKVFSASADAVYVGGQSTTLEVKFDRTVQVTGTPTLTLNTGRVVSYSGLSSDSLTMKFIYTVQSGDYAFPLGTAAATLGGCSNCVTDKNNSTVIADITLPVDDGSNPNGLKASRIKVDAVPPLAPTSLALTTTKYLTKTGAITFTVPSDPELLTIEARLVNTGNSSEIRPWGVINQGFSYSNLELSPGGIYKFYLRSRDPAGNVSPEASIQFTAFSCPLEFTYVYNPNAPFASVEPFCVGQFEAKMVSGALRFIASNAPVAKNQMDATGACTGKGPGYDLITNNEWNTVADLIARQPTNWTGGSVGNGILHRGDTQSTMPSAVTDECAPNTSICQSNGLRRSHHLPHGQVIWDFAGNAAEVIKEADAVVYSDANNLYAATQTSYQLDAKYGTTQSCPSPVSPDYCGFGKIDFTNILVGINVIWRGGAASEGNTAGVFAAKRATDAMGVLSNSGFRCVYHP